MLTMAIPDVESSKFSLVHSMVLIYAPDGTIHHTSMVQEVWSFRWQGRCSCKIVFLGALPIHLFSHFYCRLATIHSVTDGRTGRVTDNCMMPLSTADRTAWAVTVTLPKFLRL